MTMTARAVLPDPLRNRCAGGEEQPHDLGVGGGGDLSDDLHRRASLRVVAVARPVQGGADRAAAIAEGEGGSAFDELARYLHAAAPAGVPERNLPSVGIAVGVRARVEQPVHRLQVPALNSAYQHLVE